MKRGLAVVVLVLALASAAAAQFGGGLGQHLAGLEVAAQPQPAVGVVGRRFMRRRWRDRGFTAIRLGGGPMGFDVAADAADTWGCRVRK